MLSALWDEDEQREPLVLVIKLERNSLGPFLNVVLQVLSVFLNLSSRAFYLLTMYFLECNLSRLIIRIN